MKLIDDFLNKITMYRLVLYYLTALLLAAIAFSIFGILSFNPVNILFSTFLILMTCWVTQTIFVKTFAAIPNIESVFITGFILVLLITPVSPSSSEYAGMGFLVFASAWAMASKYIFALRKKHVFNPAAFGIALSALALGQSATWWVAGVLPLLPFVFFGGLLIVRKIRREDVAIAFLITALLSVLLTTNSDAYSTVLSQTLFHSALFFLGFVMLTEPLTMPPSRTLRIAYGMLVGLLFAPNVHIGSVYFSPELALLVGNVFVYLVSPKGRFMLTLLERNKLADNTYEFVFTSDRPIAFSAGQYLEWTLAHPAPDTRGNRRYLTIASSPTEEVIRLGVKVYVPASTFKRALGMMRSGDELTASHQAGDFILPKNKKKKLVFLAGGIGVTPFRSMVQYLVDTNDAREITLFYSNKLVSEIAYADVFENARKTIGLKTVYAVTDEKSPAPNVYNGMIDNALITREVPDYKDRIFYISGPHGMVEAFKKTLLGLGVSRCNIKTDYFPGFA